MSYADLDLNLTDQQKMLREMVEKFAMEVVRPAGIEIDKIVDPEEAVDGSSPVFLNLFRTVLLFAAITLATTSAQSL